MWIIGVLVLVGLFGIFVWIMTREDKIKCSKCGCEFMYDRDK